MNINVKLAQSKKTIVTIVDGLTVLKMTKFIVIMAIKKKTSNYKKKFVSHITTTKKIRKIIRRN